MSGEPFHLLLHDSPCDRQRRCVGRIHAEVREVARAEIHALAVGRVRRVVQEAEVEWRPEKADRRAGGVALGEDAELRSTVWRSAAAKARCMRRLQKVPISRAEVGQL